MSDRRLHVDVTHVFGRPYRPTGITRIIVELARAARENSDSAEAWRYDVALRCFRQVDWSDIERIIGLPIANGGSAQRSAWRRLGRATGHLFRKSRFFRFIHRTLHRALMTAMGRSGRPGFSATDLFIFADILDDDHRVNAYRALIEGSGVHVLFYCHDVIPLKFRAFVGGKLHDEFRRMIKIFSGANVTTICNSEATCKDLQSARAEMGLVNETPIVVRPGCDIEADDERATASRVEALAGPYILYVSTVEIRKNHKLLLEAYERMSRDNIFDPPQMVLVGQRGWLVDDLLKVIDKRRGAASRFTLLTDVCDADLAHLYKGAIFTVYPSLYEGWGIPVTESLYHHKFCLCSDRGALPEAGGSFVDYLDPEDSEQWALRIRYYLDHPDALLERERRIRDDFRARRWSEFRQEAKHVFARALGEGVQGQDPRVRTH